MVENRPSGGGGVDSVLILHGLWKCNQDSKNKVEQTSFWNGFSTPLPPRACLPPPPPLLTNLAKLPLWSRQESCWPSNSPQLENLQKFNKKAKFYGIVFCLGWRWWTSVTTSVISAICYSPNALLLILLISHHKNSTYFFDRMRKVRLTTSKLAQL